MPSKSKKSAKSNQEKLEDRILAKRSKDDPVSIVSAEQIVVDLTIEQAMISHWLQGQIFRDIANESLTYMLPEISGKALKEVWRYMVHKNGRKTKPPNSPITDYDITKLVTDPWDAKWIDELPPKLLFGVFQCAGLLEIPGLIGLCQARIACWCKNRTVDEIKVMFSEELGIIELNTFYCLYDFVSVILR